MRRKWKEKILKMTFEVFATPLDLILFTLFMIVESGISGKHTMRASMRRLDKLVREGKDRIIRDGIYRLKKKSWIKEDFQLTQEGKKHLQSSLPIILPPQYWDGNWYIASYDIPEKMRRKRDIFRENLIKLGFAPLHASCWISPKNHFDILEKLINDYHLHSYVILAQSNKLGKENSKDLANRLWKLNKINKLYEEFISEWQKASEAEKFWLTIKYLSILKRDPQLPLELLPDNWKGREAYLKVKKYLKFS